MKTVTLRVTEHALVIQMKDILMSKPRKTHVSVNPQMKIAPATLILNQTTNPLAQRVSECFDV